MKKAFVVARWEYLEKIKSKAFIISLVLMPAVMTALGVLPGLLASKSDDEPRELGIIDRSGQFVQPLTQYLNNHFTLPDGTPNYLLRDLSNGGDMELSKLESDAKVIAEEVEGYLIMGVMEEGDSVVEYRSLNTGNIRLIERLQQAIRDVVNEKKLREVGVDPGFVKELTKPVSMKTIRLSKSGKEEEAGFEEIFFSGYIFMMMMVFLVMTSGQLLVRSILDEKSNRIVEILVSSCSPTELMAGKILGLSGIGLTQMGFWALIGAALAVKFGIATVSLGPAFLLLLYFVLGYLFYAAVFVAAGSPISTEQEAQQLNSYLVLFLIAPITMAIPMMQNPDSTLVRVLSFIPLMTPTMMALRIPIQMPPPLEIILTLMILLLSTIGMMWVAGKIFRTAVLMYGKRPGLRELYQLLRSP